MRADLNKAHYERPVSEIVDLTMQGILCLSTNQMEDPDKTNQPDLQW